MAKRKGMSFWHARVGTAHFDFDAYGRTELDARLALQKGLIVHQRTNNLDIVWVFDLLADAGAREVEMGAAYRDRDHQLA